jgi:hypothetical protein
MGQEGRGGGIGAMEGRSHSVTRRPLKILILKMMPPCKLCSDVSVMFMRLTQPHHTHAGKTYNINSASHIPAQ